jgi:hypothetical protein
MMTDPNAVQASRPNAVVTDPSDGDIDMNTNNPPSNDTQATDFVPLTEYQCSQCDETQRPRNFYINLDDPTMDWRGSIFMICRRCWNENQNDNCNKCNQEAWEQMCQDQWQRAYMNFQEAERIREERRRIGAAFLRENTTRRLIHGTWIDGQWIQDDNPTTFDAEPQAEMDEVFDTSVDPSIQQVQANGPVTAMDSDTIWTHTQTFEDGVLTGLDDYFMCRRKECSMVCLSSHVLTSGAHIRCPACGELYRHFKQHPGLWQANRVVVYYNAVHVLEDRAELAAGLSEGLAVNDQVLIFPIIWPDCEPERIIDLFETIELSTITEVNALPLQDRLGYVMANLRDTPRPCRFLQYEFLQETKAYIDKINLGQMKSKTAWEYDHIETDGYMGIKLGPEQDLDQPWEHEEFIRAWVLAIWLADRAAAGSWSP